MLGYIFNDLDLRKLDAQTFKTIREAIPKHGVICIKNQSMSIPELIALTNQFGSPVLLPEALRFNNTQKEYPELARVSNILPDGTLLKGHKAAEYWHSDGDFWQPGQNYLFNLLYSITVPKVGGQTGFTDLRMAYESLGEDLKEAIEGLQVKVSCDEIPDFKDIKPEDREPDAYHYIKHRHVETQAVGLYIGHCFAEIHGLAKTASKAIMEQLVRAIENPAHQYIHEWEPGDLLIWDNTSVMHRGMGGYHDYPRLLYRTQAFIAS